MSRGESDMPRVKADYSGNVFHPKFRKDDIDMAVKHLQQYDFDAIAVRGVSGLTRGSIIAHLMCKGIIVARKKEARHSCLDVEGMVIRPGGHWIIVDDFIMTGATVAAILEVVTACDLRATIENCVGVYCTQWGYLKDLEHLSNLHSLIGVALNKLKGKVKHEWGW
jgi:adenine/guanine phosphoribosyltransferase-like PRPP-binding protein